VPRGQKPFTGVGYATFSATSALATRRPGSFFAGGLGLEVFDTLHAAQNHHDPEVALRARFLVRSMSVRWFQESDPPEVVRILKGYGDLADSERKSRMDRLAGLENGQGIPALCRLSRFETIDTLSKYAALRILEQPTPPDAAAVAELQKTLSGIVGSSNRPTAVWMRIYIKTLTDPAATLADWDAAAKAEAEIQSKNPNQTSREIVRDLYRYQVELLKRLDRQEEAIAVIRRTFSLLDGTPEQVTEIVDWLLMHDAFAVVLEINDRFAATFQDNPQLLYRLAEAHLKLGNAAKAEEIAAQALALRAENLDEHRLTAVFLFERRGLIDWAQREFDTIIKNAGAGSVQEFQARFQLSEMLHDQAKELAAAESLKPVCDLLATDENANETCRKARRDPPSVISRMNYFYACHFHEQNDPQKEREHLQLAIDADPQDADVLIAMFRLPQADAEWTKSTRERIADIAEGFHDDMEEARKFVEAAGNEQLQAAYRENLGLACNQYAWLVGNTFGNYGEAVKASHTSLEMRPDYFGYLDTLGRCYYAKGDFENAIKYQSLALKGSPHSGQIRRQLEFFQKEQAAQGKTPAPAGAKP
jgi:tetratricopeptide (TPR) repeat protein